jgi:hypothetical protein
LLGMPPGTWRKGRMASITPSHQHIKEVAEAGLEPPN